MLGPHYVHNGQQHLSQSCVVGTRDCNDRDCNVGEGGKGYVEWVDNTGSTGIISNPVRGRIDMLGDVTSFEHLILLSV